jgi:HK97 gp10 family phage protein
MSLDFADEGRRLKKFFEGIEKQVIEEAEKGLAKAVQQVENDAILLAPVDSGKLRASIGTRKVGFADFEVGSSVSYAKHQEFGTKHQEGTPFLRPALNKNRTAINDALAAAIKRGLST